MSDSQDPCREALKGPEPYTTWQNAATAERTRRVIAESALAAAERALAQEPYAWFWEDGSDSGVVTTRVDYEHHRARYPNMRFTAVYTVPPPPAASREPVDA